MKLFAKVMKVTPKETRTSARMGAYEIVEVHLHLCDGNGQLSYHTRRDEDDNLINKEDVFVYGATNSKAGQVEALNLQPGEWVNVEIAFSEYKGFNQQKVKSISRYQAQQVAAPQGPQMSNNQMPY